MENSRFFCKNSFLIPLKAGLAFQNHPEKKRIPENYFNSCNQAKNPANRTVHINWIQEIDYPQLTYAVNHFQAKDEFHSRLESAGLNPRRSQYLDAHVVDCRSRFQCLPDSRSACAAKKTGDHSSSKPIGDLEECRLTEDDQMYFKTKFMSPVNYFFQKYLPDTNKFQLNKFSTGKICYLSRYLKWSIFIY